MGGAGAAGRDRCRTRRPAAPAPRPTWVLSNHDVVRHRTRLGSLSRARAATLLMLALPGAAYLYTGEELGLPEAERARRRPRCRTRNGFGREAIIPAEPRRRPSTDSVVRRRRRRTDSRVTTSQARAHPWLPQPDGLGRVPHRRGSGRGPGQARCKLYRHALRIAARRFFFASATAAACGDPLSPGCVLILERPGAERTRSAPSTFLSERRRSCHAGHALLLSSGPLAGRTGILPPDTAVWLRPGVD